uniref:Myb/SANT-like domain-containing protein n=1 Tax=Setaria viridis TaxID=4556 RepID=A0A4U6W681_SETVI|nr:hypothetical protein SEVIR_2G205000v2 [Setaria viridis]
MATGSRPASTLSAAFSPIPLAPLRVGEGELPPSWDSVPTPIAMVAKGSPKLNLIARGSPKLSRFLPTISATKKKPSPKWSGAKRTGGSPRADWNPTLEKSLVEILHEYKDGGYRSDNGWNTEGWNKMVKEFHLRNKSISYTKAQIQDRECQFKRDYKMLKAARMQSGSKWNEQRNMVEGSAAVWENLMVTFPKIKKFQNNKASFPLFDALGELYDGHLAEGTYNFTSIESQRVEEPLHQIDDKPENKGQRHKKSAKIEVMMERFLEMRIKENETREKEARDKEATKGDEYSIKWCISIINTMEVTKQEKIKAYAIFTKSKENRETFICTSEEDEESTLIWLRNEMT